MDAIDAACIAAHRPHIALREGNCQSITRPQHDCALTIREFHSDELIILVQCQSDETALARRIELCQASLLHDALLSCHEEITILAELLDRNDRRDLFPASQRQQIDDGRTLCLPR